MVENLNKFQAEIEITREKMRKSLAVASSSDSSSNFSSKQKSNLSNFQSGGAPKQDDIDRIDAAGFAPQTFVSHREDKVFLFSELIITEKFGKKFVFSETIHKIRRWKHKKFSVCGKN